MEEAHHAVPVLAVGPALLAHAPAVVEVVEDEERHDRAGGRGQAPVHVEEESDDGDDGDRVRDQVDQEAVRQVVDLARVLADPGHRLPGVRPVIVAQRESLEVGEELDPKVAHEAHRRVLKHAVSDHGEPRPKKEERREEHQKAPEKGEVLLGQRLIDDQLQDPRRRKRQ